MTHFKVPHSYPPPRIQPVLRRWQVGKMNFQLFLLQAQCKQIQHPTQAGRRAVKTKTKFIWGQTGPFNAQLEDPSGVELVQSQRKQEWVTRKAGAVAQQAVRGAHRMGAPARGHGWHRARLLSKKIAENLGSRGEQRTSSKRYLSPEFYFKSIVYICFYLPALETNGCHGFKKKKNLRKTFARSRFARKIKLENLLKKFRHQIKKKKCIFWILIFKLPCDSPSVTYTYNKDVFVCLLPFNKKRLKTAPILF